MKYRYFFLNIFWIIFLSLIPVYYTWGRLAVGGDVLIFFRSVGLAKYLYQWIPYHNGLNYPINYYPLYFLYSIAEHIKANPYQVSAFLLFLLSFLAGLGIYTLVKLIYGRDGLFMLVPITFYILSPAHLNGWHYLYIYSTAPFFLANVFTIVKSKTISLRTIIFLNIIFFFSSMDLPNPKYLFYLFLMMFVVLFFSLLFRLISFHLILTHWWKFIIFFLLSAYIYFPLAYYYSHFSGEIAVKSEYKTVGRMPDYGYSTIDRMVLLHHKGVNLNTVEAIAYSTNPFITLLSYTFIVLIIINLFWRKREDEVYRYELIFFILVLIFLFFAAGPNPPLGFLYEYIVSNYVVFAFLRTTAGAVFFLSIFYAVLLGSFVQKTGRLKKFIIFSLLLVIGIVNYPYINGEYFKNFNNVNEYTDRKEYGFRIPQIYFDIVDTIENQKLDVKYLHTRTNLGYMGTRWGYFGPAIYFFLYDNHNVAYNEIYSNLANHNIGYVFTDNSSVESGRRFRYTAGGFLVNRNPLVIERIDRKEFLPHFFTPRDVIVTDLAVDDLYQIIDLPDYDLRSALYVHNEDFQTKNVELLDQIPHRFETYPTIEFRKINPTKYRLVVHQATGGFPLVFSETYHSGWRAYVKTSFASNGTHHPMSTDMLDTYQMLDANQQDQATKEELARFIDNGWITHLEQKRIAFVSKNFSDTIQNDNLPVGEFYETWFLSRQMMQIPEKNHQQVNVFANSWWIDVDTICRGKNICRDNPRGGYDFELVIEYWPQRVFYIGVITSGAALLFCLFYFLFVSRRDTARF